MKSTLVCAMPAAALLLIGSFGGARADTSEVKLPAPVVVAKSGKHCKDDPHCFNRYHYSIKPAAHVQPGQLFVPRRVTRLIPILPSTRRLKTWPRSTSTSSIR
jgi:formamidase